MVAKDGCSSSDWNIGYPSGPLSKLKRKRTLRQVLFDVQAGNSNLARSPDGKSNHAM